MIYHTTYRSPFFDLQYGFFTAPPKTQRPRHYLMRRKSRFVPSPAASLNGTIGLAPAIPHLARCTPARRSSCITTTAKHFRPQASGSTAGNTSPLPSLRDVGTTSSSTHQRTLGESADHVIGHQQAEQGTTNERGTRYNSGGPYTCCLARNAVPAWSWPGSDFGLLGHPLPLSPFAASLAPTYLPVLENRYVIYLYVFVSTRFSDSAAFALVPST